MIDKKLEDFLPNKNSSYFKKNKKFNKDLDLNKDDIINCIRKVMDPEIPVNLYDLGLIYKIDIKKNDIKIEMTLTNPNCPVAGEMPKNVGKSLESLENIKTPVNQGRAEKRLHVSEQIKKEVKVENCDEEVVNTEVVPAHFWTKSCRLLFRKRAVFGSQKVSNFCMFFIM